MINHGTLLLNDDFENVISDSDTRVVVVKPLETPNEDMIEKISRLSKVVSAERMGGDINVRISGDSRDMAVLFREMAALDFPICGMSESSNALEDTYLSLIKESR